MESTSVAAISTGGLATVAGLSVSLPPVVAHLLDCARPATMAATFASLEAVLRGTVSPSSPIVRSQPSVVEPSVVAPSVLAPRHAEPTGSAAQASHWISVRVLGPMALLLVGLAAAMALIG
ncbi:MAG: hypothetical protein WCI22_04955 [Actinomycetota bacterium]